MERSALQSVKKTTLATHSVSKSTTDEYERFRRRSVSPEIGLCPLGLEEQTTEPPSLMDARKRAVVKTWAAMSSAETIRLVSTNTIS